MGQKKTDGKAIDIQAPAATAMTFGEVYRVDGWTGYAMRNVGASDTDRGLALQVDAESIWYVAVPAAVNGARGTAIYWTAGTGFKRGSTDLTSTATGGVVGLIEEARDGNGIAAIRVFNGANLIV